MELRELETFRAVVEAGGVGRAADRLNRAQSSVTARIRQLEASLGVALFDREGRGLRLTAAGDALLGYADRLLELASEARAAVRDDVVGGRLRLGAMESVAASRLPHPLAAFHRDHPRVSVELQTAPSRELVARVQARALDAAIVGDEVDDERFVRVPLYTEELVLVGPGGRALPREPARLSGSTLLVFHGNGCAYRRRMEQWLQSRRAVPGRVLEFASYHAILASAAAGVGISLVPRSVLDIYPQRGALSVAKMPSQLARIRTALVMQRGRHVPALTQLANCLREDARKAARGK
ncbi:MAG TPA: LysR substrate-binding domain-containing protein [Luteimonas sp.]|nr:LysR substrate-binding domain-containing protein [Luteimonas sp.]